MSILWYFGSYLSIIKKPLNLLTDGTDDLGNGVYRLRAGSPISEDGAVANYGLAKYLVAEDYYFYSNTPEQAKVVPLIEKGYVDLAKAEAAFGEPYDQDAKTALQAAGIVLVEGRLDDSSVASMAMGAYPTDTATGAPAEFPDGAEDVPLKKAVVSVKPYQELNGYESLWPGGMGKNQLEPLAGERGNSGVNVRADGVVEVNLEPASDNRIMRLGILELEEDASYILNGCEGGSEDTYYLRLQRVNQATVAVSTDGDSDPASLSSNYVYFCELFVAKDTAMEDILLYPMVRLATEEDSSFAPFANVCPIYGTGGADLTIRGKNLLPPPDEKTYEADGVTFEVQEDGSIRFSGRPSSSAVWYDASYVSLGAGTYVLSGAPEGSTEDGICLYLVDENDSVVAKAYDESADAAFTLEETTYLRLVLQDTLTAADIRYGVYKPQLEKGAETAYAPYTSRSAYAFWESEAGVIYDGSEDIVGGRAEDTTEMLVFDGTETGWQKTASSNPDTDYFYIGLGRKSFERGAELCSHFEPEDVYTEPLDIGILVESDVRDQDYIYVRPPRVGWKNVYDWVQWLKDQARLGQPLQVLAKRIDPIVTKVTPVTVRSLYGVNYAAASTGWPEPDTVMVEYRADPALYIAKKIAESNAE